MPDPASASLARPQRWAGEASRAPVHRDWPAVTMGDESGAQGTMWLSWACTDSLRRPLTLRVTIARELWAATDLVVLGRRGELGRATLDHVDAFEHVDLALRPDSADEFEGGLTLTLDGPGAVEIFAPGAGEGGHFGPRLLGARDADDDPRARLLDGLASPGSLQAFGWKLGCVLDGLLDLGAHAAGSRFAHRARLHLDEYFRGGTLRYEDPWGEPVADEIYGIEGLLPLAALSVTGRAAEAEALSDRALPRFRRADGAIRDHGMLSAEGMYTVAYPLALIGRSTARADYLQDAAQQLRVRIGELRRGGDSIALRSFEDGSIDFSDWVRAWCWYLLGLARTVPLLDRAGALDLVEEFRTVSEAALRLRGDDALWTTYVREPGTPVETSGSAGIAAAWAIGARTGVLDESWTERARESAEALLGYVGAEGSLGGASQANKDGERLQRSSYRVNSQVGAGLFGQLHAALAST